MNSSQSGSTQSMNGLNEITADDVTTTTIVADKLVVNLAAQGPTPAVGDSSTNFATTAFVTNYASGSLFVTLANPLQTITGDKIFSGLVQIPTANIASSNLQAASTGYVKNNLVNYQPTSAMSAYATLASPSFSGMVTVPTVASTTSNTQAASTAFVQTNLANYQLISGMGAYAPLTSPSFSGMVTVPTAASTASNTQAASTAFVQTNLANYQLISGMGAYATLTSPNFSGMVTVPTAASMTSNTQAASTAFVQINLANYILTSSIPSLLAPYATTAAVTTSLSYYQLISGMSSYATTTYVTTALSGYLLVSGSAAKVNVTDSNASSNNAYFTFSSTASYPFNTSSPSSTQLFSDSNLYYNPSLKALSCPNFYGNINGSSTKSSLTLDNASTLGYLTFALNTGVGGLRCASNVTINPSTSTISATSYDTAATSSPSLFPSITTTTANICTAQTTGVTNICTNQISGGVINIGSPSSSVNLKAGAFSTNNGLFYPNTTGPNLLLATSSAQNFNIGSSGSGMNQYYTYIGSSYAFYITIPAPTAAYTGINLVFRRLNSSSSSPIGLQTVGGGSVLVPLGAIVPQVVIALQSINVASLVCMVISSGTYVWAQIF